MKSYHSCYLGVSANDAREIADNIDHPIEGAEQLIANTDGSSTLVETKSPAHKDSTDVVSDGAAI